MLFTVFIHISVKSTLTEVAQHCYCNSLLLQWIKISLEKKNMRKTFHAEEKFHITNEFYNC